MKAVGDSAGSSAYWADIHPRREESIFMLVVNPDAIAGLESLIQAAEQLAAAEDAVEDAKLTGEQKAVRDEARAKAKAEARAKEKARLEVHWDEKHKKPLPNCQPPMHACSAGNTTMAARPTNSPMNSVPPPKRSNTASHACADSSETSFCASNERPVRITRSTASDAR